MIATYLDLHFMKMYISIDNLLQSTIERDLDLAFLAAKSLSIDAIVNRSIW
jgi:hypothetical protein